MKRLLRISGILLFITIGSTLSMYGAGWRLYNMAANASMYPTLKAGTYYIADISFNADKLRAGDVVLLNGAPLGYDYILTKRIIAGPGTEITMEGTRLIIDGKVMEEPYAYYNPDKPLLNASIELFTVPENKFFVMGDNRNASKDSRDPSFGLIDFSWVKAKVIKIF